MDYPSTASELELAFFHFTACVSSIGKLVGDTNLGKKHCYINNKQVQLFYISAKSYMRIL